MHRSRSKHKTNHVSVFAKREIRKRDDDALRKLNEQLESKVQERTAELTKAFKLLQQVLSGVDVQIAFLNPSFAYISVNSAYARANGCEQEFFIGKNYFDLNPDDRLPLFRRVVETGEPYAAYESPFRPAGAPGGEPNYFDWSLHPVKDADEIMSGLVLSLIDVTGRRRAEQDRSRLAAAVESSADAIAITDKEWKIWYVNPAFERLTGHLKSDIVGQSLRMLQPNDQTPEFYDRVRERLYEGMTWSGLLSNTRKDGTPYEEDITFSPIRDGSGSAEYFIAIKRDITEKLRLESIAKAVDTINNIGAVFMGVRHEIGNPINIIYMILDVLKAKLDRLDKPAIEGYLDRALNEVSKVEFLLKTLRNFNMYEKPELQQIRVPEFMEQILPAFREDFKSRGIELTNAIDADTEAWSDPRSLRQVLENILANAADAMQDQENAKIAVAVTRNAGIARIRIRDNGCGMTPEQQKDLFKPFYTTKARGTGLGLVIAKKILTLMNATIHIRSRKNIGTIVDIILPQSAGGDTEKPVKRGVMMHG